ncbi:MAG: glycosyltransferase [Anaerolineales bacterium]|nr:glycosyltransferase [Anaerolineales bacterium]
MVSGSGDAFPGRLGLQQRVLPAYRAPFFDMLAEACREGLSVFAGQPSPGESILLAQNLERARLAPARNLHLGSPGATYYLCWQAGVLNWLRAWRPQVLIVEANPRYLSNRLAVRWMHARGRPVVGWGLGAPQAQGRLASVRLWERAGYLRSLEAVIAYSPRGAEQYRQLGLPADKVFVAPNAVAPRPTDPPPLRPPGFVGRPVVLFVGRLQARKRIDLLLRACAALPAESQPRLVVVGDGPARGELQALAAQVYPATEFPGARQGSELAPYFLQADLFVLPGTGGLAVQQAMAYALPVVVAEGDGTQEALVHPENGWLVSPGDLAALTQVLRQALSDAARLRSMGACSYRLVVEEVNLQAMVAVFLDVLQRVTSAG